MYICNLLNEDNLGVIKRDTITIENRVKGGVTEGSINFSNGRVVISPDLSLENHFLSWVNSLEEDRVFGGKHKVKGSLLKDDPNNSIVAVLCSNIRIYKNVPAYFRFMYINDDIILACLLYGACEFEGTQMIRNLPDSVMIDEGDYITITGKDIPKNVSLVDKSGYNYLNESIYSQVVNYTVVSGSKMFNFKTIPDSVTVLDNTLLIKHREEYEEKLRKLAEDREADAERKKRQLQEYLEKQAEHERLKAEKKKESAKPRSIVNNTSKVSAGASAFLDIVLNRKG